MDLCRGARASHAHAAAAGGAPLPAGLLRAKKKNKTTKADNTDTD